MSILAVVVVAVVGVAIVSYAGHQKEKQLKSCEPTEFKLTLGLALAVSSGMSFAIDAAQPIQVAAQQVGVKPLYSALPAYVFIIERVNKRGRELFRGKIGTNSLGKKTGLLL